jgi:small subunit ribosomal protein S16
LTKTQADAKAKAFKAEQDVNAKRLAGCKAKQNYRCCPPAVEEEVAEVESTETPAEENNEETQA